MTKQTITLELDRYLELLEAEEILEALRRAGVDNWEWYYKALQSLRENEDD